MQGAAGAAGGAGTSGADDGVEWPPAVGAALSRLQAFSGYAGTHPLRCGRGGLARPWRPPPGKGAVPPSTKAICMCRPLLTC